MKSLFTILTTLILALNCFSQSDGNFIGQSFAHDPIPTPYEKAMAKQAALQGQINSFHRQYIKFKDGTVIYAGKIVYERDGDIPKDALWSKLIVCSFKIIDVSDEGCRICPYAEPPLPHELDMEHDCFIEGLTGYSDRDYPSDIMKEDGSYSYTTIQGNKRTIPRYEYGVEATKDDYITYCKSMGLIKDVPTNVVTEATSPKVKEFVVWGGCKDIRVSGQTKMRG